MECNGAHIYLVCYGPYRNTSHSLTGKKPSSLLFGFDCRHPTEAATMPARSSNATELTDYCEELVLNLSLARALAAKSITKAHAAGSKRSVQLTH